MQARSSLPPGNAALLALAIASLSVSGPACTGDGPLSSDEMNQLRQFMLPAAPPVDSSNAFATNPMAAALGKKLYFETGFAGPLGAYNLAAGDNGALGVAGQMQKVSCASCHDPGTAGIDRRSRPDATSLGAGYTTRNAPSAINAAYSPLWQFWDGRADSLWAQALGPPEGTAEYNSNRLRVAHWINDHYGSDYNAVFPYTPLPDLSALPADGKPGTTIGCQTGADAASEPFNDAFDCLSAQDQDAVNRIYANFGKAIAAYELLMVSNNFQPSAFDAFMADPKASPMSDAAIRGARLFIGHAGCVECHRGPMFSDYAFHNIGAPQAGQYVPLTDTGRLSGLGALTTAEFSRRSSYSDDTNNTAYLDIKAPLDDATTDLVTGQFKTPSLRNVSKTAPYMHDGAYQTLWDVVNHYNFGGETGNYTGEKDPAIAPLMLSNGDLSDLVEFLQALEDGPANDPTMFAGP
jgi:cytochrome c peroxidase